MRTNAFQTYHPLVNLMYFVSVIGFSCFYLHPLCLGISLFCGLVWAVLLPGGRNLGKNCLFLLPMIGVTALMNPLFNHQGVTILGYFPGGNPLTAESILYGGIAGVMVASVLVWFLCFRQVMTDDKTVYLFGKVTPMLALVLTMTFRFVPRFLEQFRKTARARQGMGKIPGGGRWGKLRSAVAVLSGVTTWAMENAMDTADSMKARGYGLPGRTSFSLFRFEKRDGWALAAIIVLAGAVLTGGILGQLEFRCFPAIAGSGVTLKNLPFFVCYFLLCSYPIVPELQEVRRWNSTTSER